MPQVAVKPKLLRIEQASAIIGVSHWTMRQWAKQGKLRTVKLGNLRLVPAEELDRIARQGISNRDHGKREHEHAV